MSNHVTFKMINRIARFTAVLLLLSGTLRLPAQPLIKAIDNAAVHALDANDDEGFLTTHWKQDEGYNQFCPMDPETDQRSYAGCPAVAMAQIVNHLKTTNGTRFTDEDDYQHNYPNRYYTIDDDYANWDFLSFPALNQYLDMIDSLYATDASLSKKEAAALIFACGVACQQVYTSSVSGTFSVQQAYDACLRFGFNDCQLFTEPDSAMYAILNDNLANGIPALLAIESPDGETGHNVVVDGHREDGTYHVNFGFGGSLDGWYDLPDPNFPYGMSQIEGIIVNLRPSSLASVHDIRKPVLNIFPNPAHDIVTLEGIEDATKLLIYNSVGAEVLHQKLNGNTRVNIQNLHQGFYVMKVVNAQNDSFTTKLLIGE